MESQITYDYRFSDTLRLNFKKLTGIGSFGFISEESFKKHFPENTHLWIADIDLTLNDNGYIVPGLGDAGDLSYGVKL